MSRAVTDLSQEIGALKSLSKSLGPWKTHSIEFFNKVAGFRTLTIVKKLQQRCFRNFATAILWKICKKPLLFKNFNPFLANVPI